VAETCFLVVAPSVDSGLGEEAFVESLPAQAVVLDDGLVGDAEVAADLGGPVGRVFAEGGFVQCFACGCEAKEA